MNRASGDPYDLERFVAAQRADYTVALDELKNGAKRSHWIWYIFPQVAGLGSSPMAERYAIRSRREGEAYLSHPVLGPRLIQCANALLDLKGRTAEEIMGYPDCLKLRSSMTLFAELSGADAPFQKVLDCYFARESDLQTKEYLAEHE